MTTHTQDRTAAQGRTDAQESEPAHDFAPVLDTKIIFGIAMAALVVAFALASLPAAIVGFALLATTALSRFDRMHSTVTVTLGGPEEEQLRDGKFARAQLTLSASDAAAPDGITSKLTTANAHHEAQQGHGATQRHDADSTARVDSTALLDFTALVELRFPGAKNQRVLVRVPGQRVLNLEVPALRTGIREQFSATVLPATSTLGWFADWLHLTMPPTLVLTPIHPLPPIPSAAVAKGLTGPRTSQRAGDGYEFRDVGPYVTGNTLRQVDWRATSRLAPELESLYVRRTFAQSEATTVIMLDSRDDVGPEIASWGSAHDARADQKTSLDLAREAATALAHIAISKGDRVGFEDLGHPRKPVPPGTGSRHLERLRHAVSLAAPLGGPKERVRAPLVPRDALVFVLSTFLDDAPKTTITSLVARGHQVVAIDTLPKVSMWSLIDRQVIAYRLLNLARETRMTECKHIGVPVVSWRSEDHGQQLATLERATRTRRRR